MAICRGRLVPDYNPRTTSQSAAEHKRERDERKAGKIVDSADLRPGMEVEAPDYMLEDGSRRTFRQVWGVNPPKTLIVRVWDWLGGDSKLVDPRDPKQHIDSNTADYPKEFRVVKKR